MISASNIKEEVSPIVIIDLASGSPQLM